MAKFRCEVCGSNKAHTLERIFEDNAKYPLEDIIQIKNYSADALVSFLSCSNCGTVKAQWEKISESNKSSDEDKDKVKKIKEEKGKDK
jgi:hypothetical protein